MKSKSLKLFALLWVCIIILTNAARADEVKVDVKEHILPNGITLLIVEDPSAPVAAFYRYHKVGAVNEYAGMFGASHLLEHMMFKGTKQLGTWNYEAEVPIMKKIDSLLDEIDKERAKGLTDYQEMDREKIEKLWQEVKKLQQEQRQYIIKDEIDFIYSAHGGRGLNASTGYDGTDYYIMLPANKLELWAFIEADRIMNPVFREFYSERDVVYEERRMRTDNDPWGLLFENFFSHLFTAIPYGQDIVGWASDIETMRRNQVLDFLKKFYSPGNTILAVVGDVKEKEVLETVEKYFASIPPQPLPNPVFTREAPRRGERRIKVHFDANPSIYIGYNGPNPGSHDEAVMNVISYVLSRGRTSRIHKNIVEKNIGIETEGWIWSFAYATVFTLAGSPKDPYTTEDLEKAFYEQLEILKNEPVSQWELEKAFNQIDADHLSILNSRWRLASRLASAHAHTGSWKNFDRRERLKKVTPEDIMRVSRQYFVPENRTVTSLVRTPAEASNNN